MQLNGKALARCARPELWSSQRKGLSSEWDTLARSVFRLANKGAFQVSRAGRVLRALEPSIAGSIQVQNVVAMSLRQPRPNYCTRELSKGSSPIISDLVFWNKEHSNKFMVQLLSSSPTKLKGCPSWWLPLCPQSLCHFRLILLGKATGVNLNSSRIFTTQQILSFFLSLLSLLPPWDTHYSLELPVGRFLPLPPDHRDKRSAPPHPATF